MPPPADTYGRGPVRSASTACKQLANIRSSAQPTEKGGRRELNSNVAAMDNNNGRQLVARPRSGLAAIKATEDLLGGLEVLEDFVRVAASRSQPYTRSPRHVMPDLELGHYLLPGKWQRAERCRTTEPRLAAFSQTTCSSYGQLSSGTQDDRVIRWQNSNVTAISHASRSLCSVGISSSTPELRKCTGLLSWQKTANLDPCLWLLVDGTARLAPRASTARV